MDVYDHFGLVTDKSIFGHCIYLTDDEYELIRERQSIVSCCPMSNSFLGSGLFSFERMLKYTDRITLASDWAAGNSLSMLGVMDEFYKVSMLQDFKIYSLSRWFISTLGSSKALGLDDYIGNFDVGMDADFVVIDPGADEVVKYRVDMVDDIYEYLFIIMTLGSKALIKDTCICGESAL